MANAVSFKFDMTEMNKALASLNTVSNKLPSELVNQKSWRIFQKATWWMPQVSAATISGELGASARLRILKSGARKGQYARSKKANFFGQGEGSQDSFPLLAAIVQSRSTSENPSPWKGVNRATGAKQMIDAMKKVYGARQKSRAYFKACFATIRDVFKQSRGSLPFSDPKSRGAGTVASLARDRGRIADAKPATKGTSMATATFWLISPKHDVKNALDKYAAPVLQRAVDEEASSTQQHADEEQFKEAIRVLGIRVT